MNKIHYNPALKELARKLRSNSTMAEIRLWAYLKGKQLMGYDFHRQKPIDNYIADFFCSRLMLAVEVDGYTHGFDETLDRDAKKDERLGELGITTLRFSDEDVMDNIEGVIAAIEDYVRTMKGDTPLPSF